MADELDGLDEEERIKKWIAQNVPWIIAGLAIGLGGIYGYRYWQDAEQSKISSASDVYQSIVTKYQDSEESDITAELDTLRSQYPDTSYYLFGELFHAKQQANQGDFEGAEKTLQTIVPLAEASQFADLVRTRIARVQLQAEKADDVLATLSQNKSKAFVTIAEELKGDAYVLKGEIENARTAYQEALQGTRTQNLPLLLKLRKLPAPEVLQDVAASATVSSVDPSGTITAESEGAVVQGSVAKPKSEAKPEPEAAPMAKEMAAVVSETVSSGAEALEAISNAVSQ